MLELVAAPIIITVFGFVVYNAAWKHGYLRGYADGVLGLAPRVQMKEKRRKR